MIAVIPLRGFGSAKTRLALDEGRRAAVAAAVAERVVAACREAGWEPVVVSSAAEVTSWCLERSITRIADPGAGLDSAAGAGVATRPGPWSVVHGDLPLLISRDLDHIADWVRQGATVLAPSRDGGTNLIAATGPFEFSYGPGSFARHLARAASCHPRVLVRPGLAAELDTPADLAAVTAHPDGRWLLPLLV